MKLPKPRFDGRVSVEKAIKDRRTVRSFSPKPLEAEHLSQLLWAAQGITGGLGSKRAAPSAGALYPMDVYAVVGKDSVGGVEPGVYHYDPKPHSVSALMGGDRREALAKASLSQMWMARAPVNLVVTAEYERITGKYGRRGIQYAMIEAGHIGQNIFLQAVALGLGAGIVGAFNDAELVKALSLPHRRQPLLAMPVGRKR